MDTAERSVPTRSELVYDGFISYSHAADGLLAPRLQSALQRFAKPWWKRRAVRIFRDESSLSANPHLWSSITEALDTSGWFVLLLSPDAAQSPWVNQEIEYWVKYKDPSRILPVVTDGEFAWDREVVGDSVPEALRHVFTEEPRWVDLRFARDEEQLDLQNPRFSAAVADVASSLRGIPKDELESEEVKQHRRTIRTAWAAAALVGGLAVAATVFGIQSAKNAREAETQRLAAETEADRADANAEAEAEARVEAENNAALAESRELAAAAINNLDVDPELSILLSLEAISRAPEADIPPPETRIALRQAIHSSYLTGRFPLDSDEISFADLSPDGSRLVVVDDTRIQLYAVEPWGLSWDLGWENLPFVTAETAVGCFGDAWFTPSGEEVVIGVLDETSQEGCFADSEPDESNSASLLVVDSADGAVTQTATFSQCPGVLVGAPSPDGSLVPIVTSDLEECEGPDAEGQWRIDLLDLDSLEPVRSLTIPTVGNVSWSGDGSRISHSSFHGHGVVVYDTASGEVISEIPEGFFAQLSPDGSLVAASDLGVSVIVYDVETGAQTDRLTDVGDSPSWIDFSADGSLIFAGGEGGATAVWNALDGRLRALLPNTGEVSVLEYHEPSETIFHIGDEYLTTWDMSGGVEGSRNTIDLQTWVQGNSVVSEGSRGVLLGMLQNDEWGPFLRTFDATTGLVDSSKLDVEMGRPPALLTDGRVVAWPAHGREDDSLIGPVIVWDPETHQEVPLIGCAVRLDSPFDNPQAVECADDGTYFDFDRAFSWGGDRFTVTSFAHPGHPARILVFDGASLDLVDELEAPPEVASIEQMGDGWVVGSNLPTWTSSDAKEFTLYRSDTWEPMVSDLARISQPSHGGDLLAIPVTGGGVVVRDTTTGAVHAELVEAAGRVRGLAFSPDNSLLMTSSTDGFVRIWDLATEREIERIPLDGDSGDGVWLDAETIAIGTANGLWTNISIDPDDLLELALGRLNRSFTDEECELYRIDPCPTLEEMRTR
jgi:WD40 repeat protein